MRKFAVYACLILLVLAGLVACGGGGGGGDSSGSAASTTDTTPPALAVTVYASPSNLQEQTIAGTVEAGASVTVTISSGTATAGPVTVNGTVWSCPLTEIAEGDYTVTVEAADAADNKETVVLTLTCNLLAPDLTVKPVLDPNNLDAAVIGGTVAPGADVAVVVDGVAIPDADVFYPTPDTWEVVLPTGMTGGETIVVTADDGSDTATIVTFLVVDINGPEVAAMVPADGSSVDPGAVEILVTFSDLQGVDELTVDEASILVDSEAQGIITGTVTFDVATQIATFTPDADLAASDVITVTVTGVEDEFGNVMAVDWVGTFTTNLAGPPPAPF